MKRLFLSLFVAIACNMGIMAQSSLVATLQHGSNIQAFYGDDALSAAHTAAVDGDIITLSTGDFNICDITKAITLRGEGIGKSKLKKNNSSMTFTIPHGSAHTLTLEGLDFANFYIYINGTDGTERAILSKCYFYQWQVDLSVTNCNATFVQCRFAYGSIRANENTNITCTNSKLTSIGRISNNNCHFDIQNCVITIGGYEIKNSSIKNSIIDYATSSPWSLDASNTSSHCLVINGCTGFANSWTVDSWENIFVGNPRDQNDHYQLTETAATNYLGMDGTQVGIYGGMYPYNETVSYPLVKTLDVIGTHNNGKLSVTINVE